MAECLCPMMSPPFPLCLSTLMLLSCLWLYLMSHQQQLPGFFPAINVPPKSAARRLLGCSRFSLLFSPTEPWHPPTPHRLSL